MFQIEEELKKLPAKPGVYLMHDEKDHIIYVGKAVSLKNRVRQYFQASRNKGAKIDRMVSQIARFEYIVTDSEVEALVLECNLIKEHRPKYNTMLMDDKGYPFIKVTVEEMFPRVELARNLKRDKSKYFGPYTSTAAVRDTIELIRKLYCIRNCKRNLPRDIGKERPCLNYHIGQCTAPCQGYISEEEYAKSVEQVIRFLNGHYEGILQSLEQKMQAASEELQFEKAMEYRELLKSVQQISQKQKMTSSGGADRDVIAVAKDNEDAVVQIFFIRGGRLIGRDHFFMQNASEETESALLSHFIKQFYAGTPFVPAEIMLSHEPEEQGVLEVWLSEKRGHKVHIRIPQKGQKEKLVDLAAKNAQMVLHTDKERLKREEGRTIGAVKELEKLLGVTGIVRMEAFDISNTSGFHSVGSMVVYEKGKPVRNAYRKFRIKSVQGPDDYASMEEVLRRRFAHTEADGFGGYPEVILMDGGKGQVHIAETILEELGISVIVCGMVKDDRHRTRGLYFKGQELAMDVQSEAFKLITRIQDEAHRFAIEYHRKLRGQGQVHSVLDEIKGIGPARRRVLMKHFEGIEKLREASVEELASLPNMTEAAAKAVYTFFHS